MIGHGQGQGQGHGQGQGQGQGYGQGQGQGQGYENAIVGTYRDFVFCSMHSQVSRTV